MSMLPNVLNPGEVTLPRKAPWISVSMLRSPVTLTLLSVVRPVVDSTLPINLPKNSLVFALTIIPESSDIRLPRKVPSTSPKTLPVNTLISPVVSKITELSLPST